jgi:DNA polymerase elongation subunit (family B)
VRIEEVYEPCFYVYAKEDLGKLTVALQEIPQVKHLNITSEKLTLGSEKKTMVLEVVPKTLGSLSTLARMVDSWGKFHRYLLFNVDLRLPTRYLHSKGLFCNAQVKADKKRCVLRDTQWAIDYPPPSYSSCQLKMQRTHGGRIGLLTDTIQSMSVDDCVFEEENEADTILSAVRQVHKVDPDILYTENGDSILFPLLYHRAKHLDIEHQVHLGREYASEKTHTLPMKTAKSYFSYGHIIYRPAFYTLKGRVHIDTENSFLYGESGLRGLVDISRCSNIPLQLLSRLGPGTAISQMQVNRALDHGYLIPWKKTLPETWKTAGELLNADRGGLILEPAVGLHENVIELDYASD